MGVGVVVGALGEGQGMGLAGILVRAPMLHMVVLCLTVWRVREVMTVAELILARWMVDLTVVTVAVLVGATGVAMGIVVVVAVATVAEGMVAVMVLVMVTMLGMTEGCMLRFTRQKKQEIEP